MTRGFGLFLIAVGVFMEATAAIALLFFFRGFGGKQGNKQVDLCVLIGIVAITLLGTLLLILGIRVYRNGKSSESIGFLTKKGSGVGNYTALVPMEKVLDGVTYTTLFTPATKGKHARPSSLKVSVPVEVDGEFEIVPETGFDRFAKRWGLAEEIQTFDEEFDRKYFVRSDTVEFTEIYLENPDNRGILANLHQLGFGSVVMLNRQIHATWVGFDPLKNDTPDLAEEVGARLILLARKLPPDLPDPDLRAASRRRQWQTCLWLGLIGFALTILSLIAYPPLNGGGLFLRAMPVFFLGFPICVLLAGLLLRGTSRSHYAWRGWVIGAVIMFPVGSLGSIALLNGMFDRSPAIEHDAQIVRKYTTRSKNKTHYHVECASWNEPGETENFQVSFSEYGKIVEGRSQIQVTTHQGWLGMEWVKGKQLGNIGRDRKNGRK